MLSGLVESVEYVALETPNNCLIGYIARFDVSKDFILVWCSKSNSIYLFKRNGKFITKIGNRGRVLQNI